MASIDVTSSVHVSGFYFCLFLFFLSKLKFPKSQYFDGICVRAQTEMLCV